MGKRFGLKKALISGMLIVFVVSAAWSWAVPADAVSRAGSAEDPLVTKGWADAYINAKFNALQAQIDTLKQKASKACHIQLVIGSRTAYVNGKAVEMDTAAEIMGKGYTMVPARMIGEALGMTVSWDAAARKVTYGYGQNTMVLTVGSTKAYVNGKLYPLPYEPKITAANRTLVHVRFAEALGCRFTWDESNRRVDIYRD